MLTNDLDGNMDCYAPPVEIFFLRTNLDSATLRAMKAQGMRTYSKVTHYEITGLRVEGSSPERVTVAFRKNPVSRSMLIFVQTRHTSALRLKR